MISILIPIYNGIEFIEESVSSVLNQTYDQWELLIGINGHPENSNIYKIAKEYETKAGQPLGKVRVIMLQFLTLMIYGIHKN
jgi:glycosyltransferase involved in cell wall biosynthesis